MHQEEVCTESQRERITVLQTGDLWHGFYLFQHSAQNSLTKIPIATGQWIHLQRFSHALAWGFCCSIPATVPGNHVVNSPCTALKIYLSLSSAYEWASFLGTAKEKKNPLNKLFNFFCWTIVQVAGAKAFTKLARCKCSACFACTTNKLKWGNRTEQKSSCIHTDSLSQCLNLLLCSICHSEYLSCISPRSQFTVSSPNALVK